MRILVDTNVVLDVLLAREPWLRDAADLLSALERRRARGFVAGHAITTVYYLVARERGAEAGRRAVSDLLDVLDVVPPSEAIFRRALSLKVPDFEDAVQIACALRAGADAVATRNESDFEGGGVRAEPPGAILAQLSR